MIAPSQRPPLLTLINPNSSLTNLAHMGGTKVLKPFPHRQGFTHTPFPLTPPRLVELLPVSLAQAASVATAASAALWLPPIDWRIVCLCCGWYFTLIILSNSTKLILTRFPYPVTLTEAQFVFNCVYCLVFVVVLRYLPHLRGHFPLGTFPKETPKVHRFVRPTRLIWATTLPMGCFQFVGHLTLHKATSLVPVSLVHTVKALLPLATVVAYRVLFKRNYSRTTYVTLTPLVVGIMITCYKPKAGANESPGYLTGLIYAFTLMLIFVLQNIFSKKRLTVDQLTLPQLLKTRGDGKVDKLTILFFCLAIGFCFTLPVYLTVEWRLATWSLAHLTPTVFFLMVVNGFSHFVQLFLAFQILGLMLPINYSIANIMKRIIIILVAFLWELKHFHRHQVFGLVLTLLGLYSYDRWGVVKK